MNVASVLMLPIPISNWPTPLLWREIGNWQHFRIGDSSLVAHPSAGGAPVVPFPVALCPLEGLSGGWNGGCLEAPRGRGPGGFRVFARPAPRRRYLPGLTSCAQDPRKCGRFRAPEKTRNFFQKTSCIADPVLISYSPVAPLRATPGATRRLIFERRKLEVKENCNVNEIARFLAKRIRAYDGCLGIMRR